MTRYQFKSYSRLESSDPDANRHAYDWCVYLDESDEVLSSIEYVKYILHPTFPSPERMKTNASEKFALYSNGWGEFKIQIEVKLKTGELTNTSYYLKLEDDNWPVKEIIAEQHDAKVMTVYSIIADSNFNWRKKSTIISKANLQEEELELALNKLENENLIRKSYYNSIDNQILYGVTRKVGVKP